MLKKSFVTSLFLFSLLACSTGQKTLSRSSAQMILTPGDQTVGTYISKPKGFSTSSYWIEAPEGLIFVDTQFLLSSAEEMIRWSESVTGKKVILAIVLHPNPDKFNGVKVFKEKNIPVLTSDQVRVLIPEVHEDRHHWFYDRFKPDYPNEVTLPESFGAATREYKVGGVALKLHVLGAGASESHVVVQYRDHVFVGDLIANLNHSWLEIGKTDQWLKRLEEIRAMKPEHVHPGRGPSGGIEVLERQMAYLKTVIQFVAAENPRLPPNEKGLLRVQNKIEERFPGYGHAYFLEIGLPAEWERQAQKNVKPK